MHHEQAFIQSESISNHLRIIEGHLRIISLRTEQKDIRDRVINLLKIMADLQTDMGSKPSPENGLKQTQSPIYGLVSVSRSLVDESKIPLVCETIYSKAKVRNAQLDLTGYLIHFANSFIQFLEGPKENLEYLYGRIVLNPNHENTRILFNGPIEKRYFLRSCNAEDLFI